MRRPALLPGADAGPPATFGIAELAQEFDVTPRAIRFYEDVGLLAPARAGLTRIYTQRDRTRLRLTLRGKRLGLTLQGIKELIDMYDSQADTVPQLEAVLDMLRGRRAQLERQRADLETTLGEIGAHEARCRLLLAGARRRRPAKAGARG